MICSEIAKIAIFEKSKSIYMKRTIEVSNNLATYRFENNFIRSSK